MSTATEITLHPQHAVHALSLLSSPSPPAAHHQARSGAAAVEPQGSDDAQSFWLAASKLIAWIKPPTVAYGTQGARGKATWFPDGNLNTSFNCLDRHVLAGFGDRPAFHHYSPLPQARAAPARTMSYKELLEETKILAGVLRHKLGVKKGDRVIIYMPMILEGAVAMLACARIGAIHSVVFGGFAPKELAKRIDDAKPKAILAASCGLEPKGIVDYTRFVKDALGFAEHKGVPVLMLRRDQIEGHQVPELAEEKKEFDWQREVEVVRRSSDLRVEECEEVEASHPLYVLYTSGTTGMPKGVVRDNGGHAVGSRYTMEHTFGLKRDDTIFTASDYGWVVGHSFCVYSPLLVGCTSVIFEGKPILPDAGVFWKIVETHKVNCLFTAPTALRAIRREDPSAELMAKYDLSSLRSLFLAGERSEPGIINHYQGLLKKLAAPGAIVNDNYWSTESGSPITAIQLTSHFPPLAPRPGSAGLPLPGMDVRIVDDEGQPVKRGDMGNIVLATPLPPTALMTVWNNEERFQEAYFDRFRGKGDFFDTGDAGVIDEQGYVSVLSRADDLINCAGHRLGTSLLEQVVSAHPLVAECCVVGLPDELKGHVPFALVTRGSSPEAQSADLTDMLKVVNDHVRTDVGSIATLGGLVCGRLPKTRSGKTLRRTVKDLVEHASVGEWDANAAYPPTIEDVSAVEDARKAINAYFKAKKEGAPRAKL
ncbi:putative amp-binding enzyme [Leucosporidium creatinivorum]|uniref:Putative amp-binding enzyme n=1 Tax=Leucosporidium creatinivorum TaxID=106004 RepID=A0A1Y2ELI5_9BASI|nr:putative amp-binding enzyme [Leucosporidium creatinivorum]